jgi:hypothetical protein
MFGESKPISSQLETLRDQFARAAEEAKARVAELDKLIVEAKASERRKSLDETLDLFTHDYATLRGHDVTFLIAKTKAMGEKGKEEGAQSPLATALTFAKTLSEAAETHDLNISAGVWDKNSKWLRLKDSDCVEKACEKPGDGAELAPLAKEIMLANTPDRAGARNKHYIVITDGAVTDDPTHAAQLIATALSFNPKLSFDFITLGNGDGNVLELVAKIEAAGHKPGIHAAAKAENLEGAVLEALTARFAPATPAPEAKPATAAKNSPGPKA